MGCSSSRGPHPSFAKSTDAYPHWTPKQGTTCGYDRARVKQNGDILLDLLSKNRDRREKCRAGSHGNHWVVDPVVNNRWVSIRH